MNNTSHFIKKRLAERQHAGNYRELRAPNNLIDFCSNDYLGFARSFTLKQLTETELLGIEGLNGATGSRLITGNTAYCETLEREIAAYHHAEAGLIFNSGYDANIGLFSSLPQRGDTVIADELIHASIIDGIRLSNAHRYSFKHNDLSSLEEKLKHAKGMCYVVIESIYSMDGDTAPIAEIADLADSYNASLIVDEAHATGVFGNGLVNRLGLQSRVFARVVTFGKALGCHGAIILGDNCIREYLINFARSFIYTTAAPIHQLAAIKMAYQLLKNSASEIQQLQNNIEQFKIGLGVSKSSVLIPSNSAIHCLVIGSNEKARQAAHILQTAKLDVRPILSPTVAAGTERLRICLHAYNTPDEVQLLTQTLNSIL